MAAAEAVFAEGYHDASMAEIARRAGFAAGTIYLYFEDKADLYGAVVLEKMEKLQALFEETLRSSDSAAASLRETVRAQFAFHEEHQRFFEILLQQHQVDSSPLHRKHWDKMEMLKKSNLTNIQSCVARGQAAGELREGDPRLFGAAFLGVALQITRQWLRDGKPGRLTDAAPFAADCFLHGAMAGRNRRAK